MCPVGLTFKAAVGPNYANTDVRLFRGDGFFGFEGQRNTVQPVSEFLELNTFLEFHYTEKCRVKACYNVMWMAGVTMVQDQIDFNLEDHQGTDNRHGSVYWYGPSIEVEFLF